MHRPPRSGSVVLALLVGCGEVSAPSTDASVAIDAASTDAPVDADPGPDAAPVMVALEPVADADLQDSNRDGTFDLVRPETSESVIVRLVASDEFRAAFEFDLAAVPTDRTITSARLILFRGSASLPGVVVRPHGYRGDGVITLADANVDAPIAPELTPANAPTTGAVIDVTSFVASLRASGGRHAGVLLRPTATADLTSIYSRQAQPALRPRLELTYE